MTTEKNIYQRVNAVMQDIHYIKKDAQIQGYKAVTHDNVVSVVRKSMVENGIVCYPVIEGESNLSAVLKADGTPTNMIRYEARFIINFVNVDVPEDKISVIVEAHANDNGDKAPGKAVTYATKAAILKLFLIETGESDESRAAEFDPSDDIKIIRSSTSLDDLKKKYAPIHAKWKDNKQALTEIILVKDEVKAGLLVSES